MSRDTTRCKCGAPLTRETGDKCIWCRWVEAAV